MTSKNEKSVMDTLYDMVMAEARDMGATYPTMATCGDDDVCIVDTDTGKVYRITVQEED